MTTAIYFNETPTQQNARGNSERQDSSGDRNGKTANYERKAKLNSKIKKLRIRLIIAKKQATSVPNFLACIRIGNT